MASTQVLIDAVTTTLPLPPLPPLPPSVDRRDDIPKTEMPPCKSSCLFTLGFRYKIRESFITRPTRGRGIDYGFVSTIDAKARRRGIGEVRYGIRDTWVDPAEAVLVIALMTLGEPPAGHRLPPPPLPKNFSDESSSQNQKHSLSPDLFDASHHSPPRTTHHLRPYSSAATATLHATATTAITIYTPPPTATTSNTSPLPPSPTEHHHISTTDTTTTSSPPKVRWVEDTTHKGASGYSHDPKGVFGWLCNSTWAFG
nr:hypothetical protein [Tanacetum cinerariifolium]